MKITTRLKKNCRFNVYSKACKRHTRDWNTFEVNDRELQMIKDCEYIEIKAKKASKKEVKKDG
jgi:hypothetical protein